MTILQAYDKYAEIILRIIARQKATRIFQHNSVRACTNAPHPHDTLQEAIVSITLCRKSQLQWQMKSLMWSFSSAPFIQSWWMSPLMSPPHRMKFLSDIPTNSGKYKDCITNRSQQRVQFKTTKDTIDKNLNSSYPDSNSLSCFAILDPQRLL